MKEEILNIIRGKGLLVEKEVFDFLNNLDEAKAREFLGQIEKSGQKMVTKSLLNKNFEFVKEDVKSLGGEKVLDSTTFRVGVSLEIKKETSLVNSNVATKTNIDNPVNSPVVNRQDYQVFYANTKADKKLELSDFVNHFRARYNQMQGILMGRAELQNLVSINKITGERQQRSIIAIVTEKRVTKNRNLILKVEDLTGTINCVVKLDKEEVFAKADEIQLDDIVGIKGAGNREMLFVQDIYFPDAVIFDKTRFDEEKCIAFLSDIHAGSDRHLSQSMERFLEWINSDDEIAKKVRYIFIVGDNVDGIGIYPTQEKFLKLKSMEEQYTLLASYLKRIPKHITMFMCPGQHDSVRVAEPQPVIGKKYASGLYEIENLVLVTNPTLVKLLEKNKEFKVLMYHGASIHSLISEIPELRMMKAHKTPAKALRHMLKRRHLAPTHSSVVYIPNLEKDPLVISEVPDVLCTGEVHKADIENYKGILCITGSCWQGQTDFEEKIGNEPDPAKVPVLNLHTRELKILDFGVEEEINKDYNALNQGSITPILKVEVKK